MLDAVVASMAKKTVPRKPIEAKRNLISIRGREGWLDWLKDYAAFRRVPVTSLIDQVLNEAAKRDGFRLPPER